jgi:hypothetical protein
MHQAIQDRVGHGGVGNDFVPLVDRKLAANLTSSLFFQNPKENPVFALKCSK